MKKLILAGSLTTLLAGAILTACQSSAQKVEAAQEKVQEAKKDLKAEQKDSTIAAIKIASAEEWAAFKKETELKIKNNQVRIDALKVKIKKAGNTLDALYENRIDALEQKNKELEERMDNYGKGKSDWESFKSEFNHDMDGLGQALKEFTINNKK